MLLGCGGDAKEGHDKGMAVGGRRHSQKHSKGPQSLGPHAQLCQGPPLERIVRGATCPAVSG
eukprot:3458035-Lingulodinium_polyedra.AAC.1